MQYPRAAVAVSVFVLRRGSIDTKAVACVLRGKPPAVGQLSVPGGKIRLGESMVLAAARETLEETGLTVDFPKNPAFYATDAITMNDRGDVQFHYTISHLLAFVQWKGDGFPEIRSASDAADAFWVDTADIVSGHPIRGLDFVEGTATVVERATEEWTRRGISIL